MLTEKFLLDRIKELEEKVFLPIVYKEIVRNTLNLNKEMLRLLKGEK